MWKEMLAISLGLPHLHNLLKLCNPVFVGNVVSDSPKTRFPGWSEGSSESALSVRSNTSW